MFKFTDSIDWKYNYIGDFSEGLTKVRNRENLYGYIDKIGNEVIPCKFKEARDFLNGFVPVKNEEDFWGYIDKKGNVVIPFQFKNALPFGEEGLAPVQNYNNLWGYIDESGKQVIDFNFVEAYVFKEGYAVTKKSIDDWGHIDLTGHYNGGYNWVSFFDNGLALVEDRDCNFFLINTNLFCVAKSNIKFRNISWDYCCDIFLFQDKNKKYGYLDKNFEVRIPSIYFKAHSFKENMAVVEFNEDYLGFINKNGECICFSKQTQYTEIKDFSEGLAAVKNIHNLWGFVNKRGREVITCKYSEVGSFSEGLVAVSDVDGNLYYINKRDTKKIEIPKIYSSVFEFANEKICITAESEIEFKEKKLMTLKQIRENLTQSITEISLDVEQTKRKERKKTNKNT